MNYEYKFIDGGPADIEHGLNKWGKQGFRPVQLQIHNDGLSNSYCILIMELATPEARASNPIIADLLKRLEKLESIVLSTDLENARLRAKAIGQSNGESVK